MRKILEEAEQLELGMSNCDHSIDDGLAEALRVDNVYAQYSGWDFCGYVWAEGDHFICQVWRHHSPLEEITEDTLQEIMETVSDKYGYN